MASQSRGAIEEGSVIFENETEKDVVFVAASTQTKDFPFPPMVKLTSVLSAENNLLYAAKNLLYNTAGAFVPTFPLETPGLQTNLDDTTDNHTLPAEYSLLNSPQNISNKARTISYNPQSGFVVQFDNSYTEDPSLIQLFFQMKYTGSTNFKNGEGLTVYFVNEECVDNANITTTTNASIVITIANGTANGGGGPTNGQLLKLTMYGDAASEEFDILFDSSTNVSASSFTDDGDNTYSATIGIKDSPTDDQIATLLETLFDSRVNYVLTSKVLGGGGGGSTVTITGGPAQKTTYDIADNGTNATGISIGAPVAGAYPIYPHLSTGTETLQFDIYTLHPTDKIWKPLYDGTGRNYLASITRQKLISSGVSLPSMVYANMKYRWFRIDIKNHPHDGYTDTVKKVKGFNFRTDLDDSGDQFRISDVSVVIWNDEKAELNWKDLKNTGIGQTYDDFLTPTTTNNSPFVPFIPWAHTPSNIGVTFTNVTTDGMKVITTAPFFGVIRYLCSVQG